MDLSPTAESPPSSVEVPVLFVVTNVDVAIQFGVPPVEIERMLPRVPAVLLPSEFVASE